MICETMIDGTMTRSAAEFWWSLPFDGKEREQFVAPRNVAYLPINTTEGQKTVDARKLHRFLGSKQQFSDWVKKRIDEYQFVENEDYFTFHKITKRKNGQRGADVKTEYALTLDMGKELAMVERNAQGRKVRKYFIEVEQAMQQLLLPIGGTHGLRFGRICKTALPTGENPAARNRF